ncbi:MAG: small, acid-soluble spore protein, alpha/beta type [Bacillota bacterium]
MTETHDTAHPKRYRVRRSQDTQQEVGVQGEDAVRESLKEQVARDLGLADDLRNPDELSVREAGKIGGQMVRRLISMGKRELAEKKRQPAPDAGGG